MTVEKAVENDYTENRRIYLNALNYNAHELKKKIDVKVTIFNILTFSPWFVFLAFVIVNTVVTDFKKLFVAFVLTLLVTKIFGKLEEVSLSDEKLRIFITSFWAQKINGSFGDVLVNSYILEPQPDAFYDWGKYLFTVEDFQSVTVVAQFTNESLRDFVKSVQTFNEVKTA